MQALKWSLLLCISPVRADPPTPRPGTGTMAVVAPRPATERTPFTVGDLRRAIPKHCFERSLWRSSAHLVADLCAAAALFLFSQQIDRWPLPPVVKAVMWAIYWFFQGAVCTGEEAARQSGGARRCHVRASAAAVQRGLHPHRHTRGWPRHAAQERGAAAFCLGTGWGLESRWCSSCCSGTPPPPHPCLTPPATHHHTLGVRPGVWVIAHECGHQAFSNSQLINDTVGFVLHSCLCVPYFSWCVCF